MPYDLITKASEFTVLAIALAYVIKNCFTYVNKERADRNKERQSYDKLVEDVRQESRIREDKLTAQLDKYNQSLKQNTICLKEISENIKAIPSMQKDIKYLKEKVK